MADYVQKYRKPPITEAVIDFQLEGRFSDSTLEKLKNALQTTFPEVSKEVTIGVQIGNTEARIDQAPGFKLTSKDNLDIVLLRANAVANSRLAPYEGWEKLRDRAKSV